MATTYEKVAGIIGDEMDNAWKNIMEKLAKADVSAMSGEQTLSNSDLQDFFKNLGGAHIGINFSSLTPIR